jgi:hypothetical protein
VSIEGSSLPLAEIGGRGWREALRFVVSLIGWGLLMLSRCGKSIAG